MYKVKFELDGLEHELDVEAGNKSDAIEQAWKSVGIMINIKEILEIGN